MTQDTLLDGQASDEASTDGPAIDTLEPSVASSSDGFEPNSAEHRSLIDDLTALYDDGKTYATAEIAFQKSRGSYAASRAQKGAVFAAGALGLIVLASIGLVVGLIIALASLLTIWGSTALIIGLLVLGALVLGLMAKKQFDKSSNAFRGKSK